MLDHLHGLKLDGSCWAQLMKMILNACYVKGDTILLAQLK